MLRIYPVIKGSMLIGNDPECTIHIDSLALQPRHARIDTRDDTSILVALDETHPTYVNNQPIKKHILADGDQIRVGKHTLNFTFEAVPEGVEEPLAATPVSEKPALAGKPPAETASAAGRHHAWLQIMSGQNLGKTLSLNRPMTNLGKPGVATAVVTRRNDGFFLSHLEGEQTPLVEKKPIGDQSVKLEDGNTITIGNIDMLFFYD